MPQKVQNIGLSNKLDRENYEDVESGIAIRGRSLAEAKYFSR